MTDDARIYLTDDRDQERRNYLEVLHGGNGDYYVAVAPEGERTAGRGVRICTSGGAQRENPALVNAVAEMFRALGPQHPGETMHRVTFGEGDRQMVLMALAHLSITFPGWDPALNDIALKLDEHNGGRAEMYDAFRALRRDALKRP